MIRGKKSLSQTSSRQSITDWISQRKCFLLLQVSSLSTDMTFLTLMNEHERKFDQLIFLLSLFWFVPFFSICLCVVSSSVLVQCLRFSSFSLLYFCYSFAEFQFQTQTQFQFFFIFYSTFVRWFACKQTDYKKVCSAKVIYWLKSQETDDYNLSTQEKILPRDKRKKSLKFCNNKWALQLLYLFFKLITKVNTKRSFCFCIDRFCFEFNFISKTLAVLFDNFILIQSKTLKIEKQLSKIKVAF